MKKTKIPQVLSKVKNSSKKSSKADAPSSKSTVVSKTHIAHLHNQITGRNHLIKGETKTIGRKAGDLVIAHDALISREHCRIHQQKFGNFYIEDLGSTNRTYLNEKPLEPHSLVSIKPGDVLKIGKQVFIFKAGPGRSNSKAKESAPFMTRILARLRQISFLARI